MSTRPNSESRLISALVNTSDVEAAGRFSITPEMFVSYQNEYRWLISFPQTFGNQPSIESLTTKFPDFPYSEDYTDVSFICSEVRQQYDHRLMVKAVKGASEALYAGDVEEAYGILTSVNYPGQSLSYELRNALHDISFLDDYDEKVEKIGTPWPALQEVTGGIAPGDLWYVAARLGQGKSWTLGCFVRDALLNGKKVVMFSLSLIHI